MKNTLRRLVLGAATAAAAVTGFACAQTAPQNAELTQKWKDRSMYTIQTRTLEGQPANLADYKGKVVLIVNVASKCGFTPQYSDLEKLNQKFKDKGLVILGFPCNDFGGQEPGSAKEIRDFFANDVRIATAADLEALAAAGDTQGIADALSVGRTKTVSHFASERGILHAVARKVVEELK